MYLHTFSATLIGEKIYFTDADFNALFILDLKEKRIEYKAYFEGYAKYRRELFAKQIFHDGKIYFVPRNCNKIAVYDLQADKITYIELHGKGEGPIRDAFIEGDDLWMLYARYPADIYKVSLSTGKCDVFYIDWKVVSAGTGYSEQTMSMQEKHISIFGSAKQIGENWWMFLERHGQVVIYDWEKRITGKITFPYFKKKHVTGNIQEKLWLVARNESRVLEYDLDSKREKWIDLPEINKIPGDIMRIIEYGQYLLFVKQTGVIIADKKDYSAVAFQFTEKRNLIDYVAVNDKLILFPVSGNGLIVFSLNDSSIQEYSFTWEEKLTNESVEEYFSGILSEDICRLQEFIKLEPQKGNVGHQDSGGKIWNVIVESEGCVNENIDAVY